MYKANQKHLQPALLSSVNQLPEKHRQRLEQSWAGTFYRDGFCRINEEPFQVLYADCPSRPNVAVNVLVGLEMLKAGFGWSDEELYDHFVYDLQVRYAVGYDTLGAGDFELRSLYNFRQRVSKYNQEHQTNLLQQAFAQITDAQVVALQVKTGMQRIDSVQLASNIVDASRLQLLVEAIQRLFRVLSERDQARCAEWLGPYLEGSAGQYVYRVKGRAANDAHLEQIGQHIYRLLGELQADYQQETAYQVLERLFGDNFRVETDTVQPKAREELSAGSLQSVDDLEATFRRKGADEYKGYVAALSETCDPTNEVQLITLAQVAPNNVDDADLLVSAIPQIQERMELQEMHSDGGFGSPAVDTTCQQAQVDLVQTAIRGKAPDPDKFNLADFAILQDADWKPTRMTCPNGQTIPVEPGRTTGYLAHFDPAVCQSCPFFATRRCRAKPSKREPRFTLSFTQQEVNWARRRRRHREEQAAKRNLRAAVEATMRSVKHPFPAGKLPVRGRFRVTCMVIASSAMTNLRRIHRYRVEKTKKNAQQTQANGKSSRPANAEDSFSLLGWLTAMLVWRPAGSFCACFCC
jgi:hypothetical protein